MSSFREIMAFNRKGADFWLPNLEFKRSHLSLLEILIFLHLADIANQKLSPMYNFETKIELNFIATGNSDEYEADQCARTPFPVSVVSFLELSKWRGQV